MSNFVSEVLRLNAELVEAILNADYALPLLAYLIPSAIALLLKKHNVRIIFICNLLFSFTGIAWFVILIWAVFAPENKPSKPPIAKECDRCKELIRSSATVCHHCHQELKKS